MATNLKRKEVLDSDRLLAQSCLMGVMASKQPEDKRLIEPFKNWLDDIDQQIATY